MRGWWGGLAVSVASALPAVSAVSVVPALSVVSAVLAGSAVSAVSVVSVVSALSVVSAASAVSQKKIGAPEKEAPKIHLYIIATLLSTRNARYI